MLGTNLGGGVPESILFTLSELWSETGVINLTAPKKHIAKAIATNMTCIYSENNLYLCKSRGNRVDLRVRIQILP